MHQCFSFGNSMIIRAPAINALRAETMLWIGIVGAEVVEHSPTSVLHSLAEPHLVILCELCLVQCIQDFCSSQPTMLTDQIVEWFYVMISSYLANRKPRRTTPILENGC